MFSWFFYAYAVSLHKYMAHTVRNDRNYGSCLQKRGIKLKIGLHTDLESYST